MKPATVQSAPARERRMTLDKVETGLIDLQPRIVIFGLDGLGKSTFASESPSPIFICAEEGLGRLTPARFPTPDDVSFLDILDAIEELTAKDHNYQTLVIDTLDWLEPIIWQFICERDKKPDLESYGYGKGLVAALDQWRILIAALERMRRARRMGVILVAHSWIKPFKNPNGEDYERYELKLDKRAARLWSEWVDAVMFANYETLTITDDRTKRVKGVSSGARLLHTTHSAAWDAKNRYALPDVLPLSYAEFDAAMRAGIPADPRDLIAAITVEANAAGPELAAQAAEFVTKAAGDANKLAKTLNWVRAKAETQGEANV